MDTKLIVLLLAPICFWLFMKFVLSVSNAQLLSITLGLLCLYVVAIGTIRSIKDIRTGWKETEAKVLDYKIKGNATKKTRMYLWVDYEYVVDGETYQSSVIDSGKPTEPPHNEVPRSLAETNGLYSDDVPTIIQYNPANPSQARFYKKDVNTHLGHLFIAVVMTSIGILFIAYSGKIDSVWKEAKQELVEKESIKK